MRLRGFERVKLGFLLEFLGFPIGFVRMILLVKMHTWRRLIGGEEFVTRSSH